MRRRDLLKAGAAAAFTITAAPRLGRADRAKTLVFVGVADLSVLDPVITGARPIPELRLLQPCWNYAKNRMLNIISCCINLYTIIRCTSVRVKKEPQACNRRLRAIGSLAWRKPNRRERL